MSIDIQEIDIEQNFANENYKCMRPSMYGAVCIKKQTLSENNVPPLGFEFEDSVREGEKCFSVSVSGTGISNIDDIFSRESQNEMPSFMACAKSEVDANYMLTANAFRIIDVVAYHNFRDDTLSIKSTLHHIDHQLYSLNEDIKRETLEIDNTSHETLDIDNTSHET